MINQIRTAGLTLLIFTVMTGLLYPAMITWIAQALVPVQANGSMILDGDQVVGSELIGQPFDAPEYFWGRPSASISFPYNAAASAGSNLGPSSPVLEQAVRDRLDALRVLDPQNPLPVPVDLVTASGSGLDPHISLAATRFQVARVAQARTAAPAEIDALIELHTEPRQFGILGEPRVNVLELNLALDLSFPISPSAIQ